MHLIYCFLNYDFQIVSLPREQLLILQCCLLFFILCKHIFGQKTYSYRYMLSHFPVANCIYLVGTQRDFSIITMVFYNVYLNTNVLINEKNIDFIKLQFSYFITISKIMILKFIILKYVKFNLKNFFYYLALFINIFGFEVFKS